MADKNTSAPVKEWGRYMKSKMFFARIMGLIFCVVCAGAIAMLYFKLLDSLSCIILISFSMACIFISNSFLQSVKVGRVWQVINLLLALICYIAVVTFVTMGFIDGTLSLGF